MANFKVISNFEPAGDQPEAIEQLVESLQSGREHQVLLGVTGSGKTYSVAKVIERLNRPTLVLSPNKVLAAQLYAEFKAFFPKNAVEYFVSYYDYYQPEAYLPATDTYIEKDASINEHIDKLRLKATTNLLSRRDVLVVASVSCIYNIGSPENYKKSRILLKKGASLTRRRLLDVLIAAYYERNEVEFTNGKFRMKGAVLDIYPAYQDMAIRVDLSADTIGRLTEIHPLTGETIGELENVWIYPAKHFVTTTEDLERALGTIKAELKERLTELRAKGKELEAQRLEQRTRYDLEMMRELGYCNGVENYSRHLTGRPAGARPFCLLDYFPKDGLMIVDESHVSVPQVRGMYEGDRSRKQTLVDYGFRLPSALDNRPLRFTEFEGLARQRLYVSATPGPYELTKTGGEIVEQVIRPTGLIDPAVVVHPTEGQIPHLIGLITERVRKKERSLVLTLTKRTAEDLCDFLTTKGLRVRYLHSDIDTLTRIEILQDLRKGHFDVLVGINLLREGLDLPEVSLVAILGADNEGFLRSETTLIQICGRAARNVGGSVVLYADKKTGSMKRALGEMDRRRKKQVAYNKTHGVTPRTIQKAILDLTEFQSAAKREGLKIMSEATHQKPLTKKNVPHMIAMIDRQMREAADCLDFELAALLRDQIVELREMTGMGPAPKKKSRRKKAKRARRKLETR